MPTVLIVDDEPFIRRLVATMLRDVAGFALVEAPDGAQAMDLARSEAPSIVFLDVNMPVLDGYETCRRLRDLPETAEATIVMLTAAIGEEAERQAEEAGADLFLTKPFSPLDLLRLVHDIGGGGS
jgi:two-component system chemotaxis response regulator CheY